MREWQVKRRERTRQLIELDTRKNPSRLRP